MRVIVSAAVLGLAWFAAVNAVLSAISWGLSLLVADRVIPDAERSRRLLALRFLPFAGSAFISIALFAPAHLWLEPARTDERFGFLGVLAVAGALLLCGSGIRLGALVRSGRQLAAATRGSGPAASSSGWTELPLLKGIALAGVLRPRVVVGTEARAVLTGAELEVAIEHERAHLRARDNLTRALIWCTPDFLGFTRVGRRLERLWDAQAECLADARAVNGDRQRASSLASALVKVARLRAPRTACATWSLFHQPALLETRVRLLVDRHPAEVATDRAAGRLVLVAAAAVAIAWLLEFPPALHHLTELAIGALR